MITPDCSYADYVALPGTRWSQLSQILKSPRHFKIADRSTRPTRSMKLGSIADCLLFTPDDFADRYVIFDEISPKTGKIWTANSNAYRQFEADHPDQEIISPQLLNHSQQIVDEIHGNPHVRDILQGDYQVAITWKDPITGLELKGLADCVGDGFLSDLKTSNVINPSPWDLGRKVYDYQYHCQLALYRDGLRANGVDVNETYLAFVENSPPFDSVAMRLGEFELGMGQQTVRQCLELLAVCTEKDEWPGVASGIVDLWFPDFVYKEHEHEHGEVAA